MAYQSYRKRPASAIPQNPVHGWAIPNDQPEGGRCRSGSPGRRQAAARRNRAASPDYMDSYVPGGRSEKLHSVLSGIAASVPRRSCLLALDTSAARVRSSTLRRDCNRSVAPFNQSRQKACAGKFNQERCIHFRWLASCDYRPSLEGGDNRMSIFSTKILFATDGSRDAELAATTAVGLAKVGSSELHVVTAAEYPHFEAYWPLAEHSAARPRDPPQPGKKDKEPRWHGRPKLPQDRNGIPGGGELSRGMDRTRSHGQSG